MCYKWIVSTFGLLVAGCTSVPELPGERTVGVNDVVNSVECELLRAVNDGLFVVEGKGWTAGTDLKLQVAATAGANLSASLSTPLHDPGTFAVALGGGYTGTADRIAGVKIESVLTNPTKIKCEQSSGELTSPLIGNLGIYDWIAMLHATNRAKFIKQFSYELKFTIVRTGNAGATFAAIPLYPSVLGAGASVTGSRTNVHGLVIAFTANDEQAKAGKPDPKDSKKNKELLDKLLPTVLKLDDT